MQIPVLVEKVPGNGFRARGGEPFAFAADGATREEAVSKLRALIEDQLSRGTQVVALDLSRSNDKWRPLAGMLADDPLFDEWQAAIEEYRSKVDQSETPE